MFVFADIFRCKGNILYADIFLKKNHPTKRKELVKCQISDKTETTKAAYERRNH